MKGKTCRLAYDVIVSCLEGQLVIHKVKVGLPLLCVTQYYCAMQGF